MSKVRAAQWQRHNRLTPHAFLCQEERIHYLDTTEDTGLKRLDFRFAY